MIKACLFDLDGTILDTLTTISYYGNKALEKFGIEPIDKEKYRYFAGNGAKKLIQRMLEYRNEYSNETYNKVYDYYIKSYDKEPDYLTEVFDGIEELIQSLKEEGISVGVITNKPDFAAGAVCRTKFKKGLLDIVRGQTDNIEVKPNPEGALMVLGELGAKAEECLYVGDTSVDMQTGKNLGAYTIGVLWGFRDEKELTESGADAIVSKPHEIVEIVNNFKKNKKKY